MRVLGWSDGKGGVFHYRLREPLRGLGRRGHVTAYSDRLDRHLVDGYDVVVVRALHDPWNSRAWQALRGFGRHTLVYDLDDDLWAWHPSTDAYRYWTAERLAQAERNLMAADVVTTPSERLAEELRHLHPHVEVLPNTVPEVLLRLDPPRERRPGLPFVVGWQGAMQHIPDLHTVYNPIFRFMLRHRDVELRLWGPGRFEDLPAGLAERVTCYPWTASVWAHYWRVDADVLLAPLDTSDPFNQTKSAIRVQEAAALGVPVVASAGPAYDGWVEDGRTGFLADGEDAFQEALEALYASERLRRTMGARSRERAAGWTTEARASEWEDCYERATARRNARTRAGAEPAPVGALA